MKTYFYYLSSISPPLSGLQLWGYYFTNPGLTTQPSYPLTADGGIATSDFDYTSSYPVTAWDGLFYPYGYQIENTYISDILPNLKGDYTIVFSASTSNIQPLKIIYNFGDGSNNIVITKPIINSLIFSSLNSYIFGLNANSLIYQAVPHNYYALSSITTFYPSVTVLNNNLTYIYYSLTATIYPNSLYDLQDIHLVDSTQLQSNTGSNFNILEIDNNQMTTNLQLKQVIDPFPYPSPYPTTNTQNVTSQNLSTIPEAEESLVFTIE
jgi:hypothetical protein